VIYITLPAVGHAQWAASGNDIYTTNSGNVGIGTASPQRKLHVVGSAEVGDGTSWSGWMFNGGLSQSNNWRVKLLGNIQVENEGNASNYLMGNVGIGTTTPAARLYVAGGVYGSPGNANQNAYALGAQSIAADNSIYSYGSICAQNLWGNCQGPGGVVLGTSNASAAVNIPSTGDVLFNNGSNVGIGTATPSSKLHVVGNVTVDGNISAKYQDLAEWVPAADALAPGTVVILDASVPNSVVSSTRSYDTHVAGVVSASPGIVLGDAGQDRVKVATVGRVKVHVTTSNGPIQIGDLLVTSDQEGTAMRSEPIDVAGRKFHQPGTIIGKALEPLDQGDGDILVLLSLQ
jgi:hypothetical protein